MLKKLKNLRQYLYRKDITQSILPVFKKENKKEMASFFSRSNLFSWFNEFSEISISVVEFSGMKKYEPVKNFNAISIDIFFY